MKTLTPLAKKLLILLVILFLWLPGMMVWDAWKIQKGEVELVLEHPFYQGERREKKLKSLLDHKTWRARSKAAELLMDRGYLPSSGDERIAFALATGDLRYAPMQLDEVMDQLAMKSEAGYEFYMTFFGQDANIDLRFQKLVRKEIFKELGSEYFELPVEKIPPQNGFYMSLRNGIGWGDKAWLEACVQDATLKPESREWAVVQLGQLRSYDSIPMFIETFPEAAFWDKKSGISDLTTPYDVFQWIPDDRALPALMQQIHQEKPNTGNTARAAIQARWDSPIIVRAARERFLASDLNDENFNQEVFALNYRSFSWDLDKSELKAVRFPSPRKATSASAGSSRGELSDLEIKQLSNHIQKVLLPEPGKQKMRFPGTDKDNLLKKVLPSDNPELLPLLRAMNLRERISPHSYARDHSWFIGLESFGKMGDENMLPRLLSCLRSQQSAYRGLEALGDPRVIPQLKTVLPEVTWFKPAMRTMISLGWEPETEEERVFQLIYLQDKVALDENKEVVNKVIRGQLTSPEVRRREFAAYVIVGLGLEDLVPDLVEYLGVDGDGRIANYMFHSEQPELVAAAEHWREHAPLGLRIPNRVDAGWANWYD